MKSCGNCGMGTKGKDGLINCFKYKALNDSQEDKASCLYYIERSGLDVFSNRLVFKTNSILSKLRAYGFYSCNRKHIWS